MRRSRRLRETNGEEDSQADGQTDGGSDNKVTLTCCQQDTGINTGDIVSNNILERTL